MTNNDNLIISLQRTVDQFGTSILNDPKLVNILLDLGTFKSKAPIKSVIREMLSEGFMLKIINANGDMNRVTALIPVILSQTGFQQSLIEYVAKCIAFVLGYTNVEPSIPCPTQTNQQGKQTTDLLIEHKPLRGEYSERLSTGGDLKISADRWYIHYYFSGPDARYNGTFKIVEGVEIDNYILAWKENFQKYKQLKELLPSGGNSDYPGTMGMSIRFGFSEGVCLISYHMNINNEASLEKVIQDYENAKIRAVQVQQILKG